jgi:hypothetical protein
VNLRLRRCIRGSKGNEGDQRQRKKGEQSDNRRVFLKMSRLIFVLCFCLFTFFFVLSPSSTFAQGDEPVPPPRKSISKEERKRLDDVTDLRARTKLAIEMMNLSVDVAEKFNVASDFEAMFTEFGHYRGLLEYTLAFLQTQNPNENRSLDNYKRLEISLRSVAPRMETIRRDLPPRYEEYVRDLEKCMRDARSKVSDALFSYTVLPSDKENGKQQ